MDVNYIIHGDCLEQLDYLEPESIDMIYVDPPYNLTLPETVLVRPDDTEVARVDDEWDQFDSMGAYCEFTTLWLGKCRRLLKPDGTIWASGTYHNIHHIGHFMLTTGFWILNDVVWVKSNPMPNFRGARLTNATETIIWAAKSEKSKFTFNYQDMKRYNDNKQLRNDWKMPLCRGKERLKGLDGKKLHSTQKPELLLEMIISASTVAGDIILDPFFGTGTSGAVAERLGRHWIGIELEEKYIEPALDRIYGVG